MTDGRAFSGADPDGILARVHGSIRYASDVALPGMLHAALVRSPTAAGRLVAVDPQPASNVAGVRLVVTGRDLPALGLSDDRFGSMVPDQPILATDRVRHVGEPLAAVVANSEATARAAAAMVKVSVEPLEPLLDVAQAASPGARLIHADRPGNVLGRWSFTNGDIALARAATVRTFDSEYASPAAQQVTFEPQVVVARWTAGALEMWSATQSPSRVRAEVARVFGLAPEEVRIHVPPLGGGYGAKNHAKLEPLAAAISAIANAPIRLANSRAEEFVTTTKHPASIRLESGVDADGCFTYRIARIAWSAGAYAHSSPAVMRAGGLAVCGPYRVAAADVESVMVLTNLPPAGSFRGLGASQATWAGERQVDEIARALGDDPIDFRRRNLVKSGDRLPTGERAADAHWLECLESAWNALGRPSARRFSGVAVAMKHTATPSRSEAAVAALRDGTIEVRSSLVDMGQGLRGVLSKAAMAELDVPAEAIRVVDVDTEVTPFDTSTSSSRGTWAGTFAVRSAARALREQLVAAGADWLEAPVEVVRLVGGRIVAPESAGGRQAGPTIKQVVRASGRAEITATGVAVNDAPVDRDTGVAASSSHWHQGAVAVAVDVDVSTGVVRVSEAHGAAWAGRVISFDRARLQNEGGMIMGLGAALFEEMTFDRGAPVGTTLLDYRIPSVSDLPTRVSTVALEAADGEAQPTGLGESLIPAVAPAVGSAVAAATGIEPHALPLTPEVIISALEEAKGRPWRRDQVDSLVQPVPDVPRRVGDPIEHVPLTLVVDGHRTSVMADPFGTLRDLLAEDFELRSVRAPCGVGVCGACTVLVNGRAVRSCLQAVGLLDEATIETAEGLVDGHAVRDAFVAAGAAQCGTCIPGAVLAATDFVTRQPEADEAAIRSALSGNLCRCGTYLAILDAVRRSRRT